MKWSRAQERLRAGRDLAGRLLYRHMDAGIAAAVTLLALAVYAFAVLQGSKGAGFSFIHNVELRSLDARFRMRGARPVDPRVVIVGIDESTLQKVGAYPIPRNAYAGLISKLKEGGAPVIAMDMTFPLPEKNSAVEALQKLRGELSGKAAPEVLDRIRTIERSSDNDAILADSIRGAGNVILGHFFLTAEEARSMDEATAEEHYNVLWGAVYPQVQKVGKEPRNFDMGEAWEKAANGQVMYGVSANLRIIAEAAKSYGFFDQAPDADGTFRRTPLAIRYRDLDWFPSLAVQALREYEGIPDQSVILYIAENGLERVQLGERVIWPRRDGTVLINYAGPYRTYPHYSMADVVAGTIPAETFKDKIVFVGYTAKAVGDIRITPYQQADYMGVEIHANVLDNLLHNGEKGRGFLSRSFNEEMFDLGFILLFGAGMGVVFAWARPFYSTLSLIAVLAAFSSVVYYAFANWGMWLYFVIPAGTLVVNYAGITSYRMIVEEREKRKVRKTFERYVSPGVIRLIEKNPRKYFKPGGESKELTIMFSDIRSFTTISEGLTPNELVALLNEYLGEMTDIVFHRWGTLDKYIGDAIMAFWGSPFPQADHAVRACAAALEMNARLQELNLKWEGEGRKTLEVGLGINSGVVNVGNMGSERRFSWTVMGDPVNLASRLEGQTKEYHIARIISEFTYAQVKDHYVCRPLDKIRVKGKLKPVAIYELLDFAKASARYSGLLLHWNQALEAYYRQAWDEAIQKFEALLSSYPDDGPAHVFLKRSHEFFKEAPSPGWDGVYVAKAK